MVRKRKPEMSEFDDDKIAPLPARESRPRYSGVLYVTEHNNYGDVQFESPIEPARVTRKAVIGGEGLKIARETHVVVLFATYPCRVAFVPEGEDIAGAEEHAWPLAPETETPRLVHMNTAMTVVAFPGY